MKSAIRILKEQMAIRERLIKNPSLYPAQKVAFEKEIEDIKQAVSLLTA